MNRPAGGMKPSTRPAPRPGGPSTLPGVNRPGAGNRPDFNRPNMNRPTTRPSVPNLGGGGGNRPGVDRPNRPGGELPNRPSVDRPNRPGNTRPNLPGAGNRPSPGDVGDFLGMDRPVRPDTLPGIVRPGAGGGGIARPGLPGPNRPGAGGGGIARPDRPSNRPGFDRPMRPGQNDRPINIGNVNIGNNVAIGNRPSWANIDRNQINAIGNRWQNQIGGIRNWGGRYPNRLGYWNGWGNGVRNNWGYWHNHGSWFGANWWNGHHHPWCGWHYGYGFNRYPWSYWWRYPAYGALANWFAWSAPADVWSEPVYYDYGQDGNVTYQDSSVYIGGEQVATSDEFAQSAMDLATVAPPTDEAAAEAAEWLPLGTFAISSSDKDVDPTRVIQLAVDKQGVISGTLFNTQTDEAQSIQGQVDKNTQRVAFRIGESQDIVVETGIYNLTQEEAPALVHFGEDRVENWLLVRMENPEADAASASNP
ncbi:MAG: mu-protocadherin- cell-suface protein [Planctomycetia bacterium]|nr:mu-protocadherin- cell-suface protein [Planctomycetia bacterium]